MGISLSLTQIKWNVSFLFKTFQQNPVQDQPSCQRPNYLISHMADWQFGLLQIYVLDNKT